MAHVCPWWGGYFIDNPLRRWLHDPERILSPYVRPAMTAMDIGCGMGLFSIAMARLVGAEGRVIAVDIQPQMLSVLARRARAAGVGDRIQTHRSEATRVGVAGPVDFALAFYSAHELGDLRAFLVEMHACVRPEGRLLIVEPRGHVSARRFADTVSCATAVGWLERTRPRVRLSRAVVLEKPTAAPRDEHGIH